ncbi:hypothetical protein Tco_0863457 [Tanacetum coccineum]
MHVMKDLLRVSKLPQSLMSWYSFTRATRCNHYKIDVRLFWAIEDLKKAQDHSQRQAIDSDVHFMKGTGLNAMIRSINEDGSDKFVVEGEQWIKALEATIATGYGNSSWRRDLTISKTECSAVVRSVGGDRLLMNDLNGEILVLGDERSDD